MPQEVVSELAPTGVLRAAINMGNFLLVTGRTPTGIPREWRPTWRGRSPRVWAYPSPTCLMRGRASLRMRPGTGAWDIGLIGAEPQRAEKIAFTPAYVEIEATYLVPAGSPLKSIADVDKPGVRIAVSARSAYDLWLARNIKHAEVVRSEGGGAPRSSNSSTARWTRSPACARDLMSDLEKLPGARILDGQFTAVQQAVGTAGTNFAGAAFSARLCRGGEEIRARRRA